MENLKTAITNSIKNKQNIQINAVIGCGIMYAIQQILGDLELSYIQTKGKTTERQIWKELFNSQTQVLVLDKEDIVLSESFIKDLQKQFELKLVIVYSNEVFDVPENPRFEDLYQIKHLPRTIDDNNAKIFLKKNKLKTEFERLHGSTKEMESVDYWSAYVVFLENKILPNQPIEYWYVSLVDLETNEVKCMERYFFEESALKHADLLRQNIEDENKQEVAIQCSEAKSLKEYEENLIKQLNKEDEVKPSLQWIKYENREQLKKGDIVLTDDGEHAIVTNDWQDGGKGGLDSPHEEWDFDFNYLTSYMGLQENGDLVDIDKQVFTKITHILKITPPKL